MLLQVLNSTLVYNIWKFLHLWTITGHDIQAYRSYIRIIKAELSTAPLSYSVSVMRVFFPPPVMGLR
jgi:hypothetical protein